MQTRNPWSHPAFWPYINRCLLRGFHLPASSFLRTLSTHPCAPLAKIGQILAENLALFPRSQNVSAFPLDHLFLTAHQKWLARLQSALAEVTGGPAQRDWLGVDGQYKDMEKELRGTVDLIEGKEERVLEQAADWREAIGAWGILVDVGLRRDDLR